MVWSCAVRSCRIGHKNNPNKLSGFVVPSDLEGRERWKNILRCDLKRRSRVCEKHFLPDDIKSRFYGELNGVIILNSEYSRKRLRRGAVPTLELPEQEFCEGIKLENDYNENVSFDNDEELTFEHNNLSGYEEIKLENSDDTSQQTQNGLTEELSEQNLSHYDPANNRHLSTSISSIPNIVENDDPPANITWNLSDKNSILEANVVDNQNLSSTEEDSYRVLRKNIMHQLVNIDLPNLGWCISRNITSDALLFFYGDVLKDPFDEHKLCGFATKIVHMRDDKLIVSFQDKNIKSDFNEKPDNVQELESILKKLDSYKICAGGPSATTETNATLHAAYRDKFVWRHKNCAIFLEKGVVCIDCLKVHHTLTRAIMRNIRKTKKNQFSSLPKILGTKNHEKSLIATRKDRHKIRN